MKPSKYTAREIKEWSIYTEKDGVKVPARIHSPCWPWDIFKLIKTRLIAAVGVLSGKYDAIDWEE